jgi:two-component system chemotaxis sensor kinase CheA
VIKNAKDAKTIQQLKETVNRVKHDASVNHAEILALKSTLESLASLAKGKDFGALEEELAALHAQMNPGSAPKPKPKPVPSHPKQAGEAEPEPEPEPASKPEPAPEPDPEPAPTLPSPPSQAGGAQDPESATAPPTQP